MSYSKKDLDRWITKYIKHHPHERITITELAAFSGISRNTWYRNEDIIKRIELINETPVVIDMQGNNELPTAQQLVKSCKTEAELIKMVQSLLDEIIKLTMANNKENIAKLKSTATTLQKQVRERDEHIKILTAQIDSQIIAALPDMSPQAVIESTNASSFKEQFADLFGGDTDE